MADRPDRREVDDEALWKLAERLYYVLEKHDPSVDAKAWADMTEWERDYYYVCIKDVMREAILIGSV